MLVFVYMCDVTVLFCHPQEVESVKLESEELQREVGACAEQMAQLQAKIEQLEAKVAQLQEVLTSATSDVRETQAELDGLKERLKSCSRDIDGRNKQVAALEKEKNRSDLALQDLEHKIEKTKKDSKDAAKLVRGACQRKCAIIDLFFECFSYYFDCYEITIFVVVQVEHYLQQYEWITTERKYFGQANTAYDFEANNPKEASRRLQKLQETKESLTKKVNMRAMNMLGKAEEQVRVKFVYIAIVTSWFVYVCVVQYNEVMKKREIVLNDKQKIAAVIQELDEKKNEALKKAHKQVNKVR